MLLKVTNFTGYVICIHILILTDCNSPGPNQGEVLTAINGTARLQFDNAVGGILFLWFVLSSLQIKVRSCSSNKLHMAILHQ